MILNLNYNSLNFDLFNSFINNVPKESKSVVIDGIKFFDTKDACMEDFESLSFTQYAFSFIQSIYELVKTIFNSIAFYLSDYSQSLCYLTQTEGRTLNHNKFVVALHGLNCTPKLFEKTIEELSYLDHEGFDLYVPHIIDKGNVKLDIAVEPVLEEIKKWAKKEGDLELVLVGISNGSRIAKAIDAKLADANNHLNIRKIHLISIVGATNGSCLADLAHTLKIESIMNENIREEMPTASVRSKQLHEEWEKAIVDSGHLQRSYTFIASAHDWIIPNFDSTLMDVDALNKRYAIALGHGHISIIDRIAKATAMLIVES